jgi:hypothetical protein
LWYWKKGKKRVNTKILKSTTRHEIVFLSLNGSSLRNFKATIASGFSDRPISAVETIRRIGEKFEHLMEDTLSFVL